VDLASARARLELSSKLTGLVDAAEDGRLYFQFFSRKRRITHAGVAADLPPVCTLFAAVREKVPAVLQYAIDKALAGPRDGAAWRGRPVADLAAEIFRAELNNLNRRASRGSHKQTQPAPPDPVVLDDSMLSLDELVASCRQVLDDADAPDAISELEDSALRMLEDVNERAQRLAGIGVALALIERGRLARGVAELLQRLADDASDARQRQDATTALRVAAERKLLPR
jgi:hypothetical protein